MSTMADFDWFATTATGLYPVPLAAKLLNEKQRVVRSWIEGYSNSNADPIIVRQLPKFGERTVLGFLDLVEARFIKHFCDLGLSPQAIRKAAIKLRQKHKEDHPFATNKRFRTDGRKIFMEVVETPEERRIIDVIADNFVMAPMVEPSLFESILYANDLAYRWRPNPKLDKVVLDPKISFGKPVIDGFWIPTATLHRAFSVSGSVPDVADEYGVDDESVGQAIEFERSLVESPPN